MLLIGQTVTVPDDCELVIPLLLNYLKSEIYIHTVSTLLVISETYFFFLLIHSSAAVPYPLRGLTRCVFRDALLPTTVLMRGYLRYFHLPGSFNQSGFSPLTSLINNVSSARRTAAHWMFPVFRTIL